YRPLSLLKFCKKVSYRKSVRHNRTFLFTVSMALNNTRWAKSCNVDFQETETTAVPLAVELCKKNPQSELSKIKDEIKKELSK
ncbi:hypothetical protein MJM83_30400, partial [Salmonella enterica subsp. enterica serovar Montevideo]|nr:hypothetical protein [Salmonella enterica subsp. enterica serovar Montevideo]